MTTKKVKILLVEDNPADAELTTELLHEGGVAVDVSHAVDGIDALEYLHTRAETDPEAWPDLILLDLNLPRMGGLEFLAELKKDVLYQRIPVIVLSTSDTPGDIDNSYKAQAASYVTKPGRLSEYGDVISALEKFWLCAARLPERPHR